jgi:hypothetical protein
MKRYLLNIDFNFVVLITRSRKSKRPETPEHSKKPPELPGG